MGDHYLIVADVDQIQNYVFGSNQLRSVRGASILVEKLGTEFQNLREIEDGWQCLRHQGGQMVALWSGDQPPQTLCAEIEAKCAKLGGCALTVTTASLRHSNFPENLDAIFLNIDEQKHALGNPKTNSHIVSGGFSRYCDLCKTSPAQQKEDGQLRHQFGEDDRRFLCKACQLRVTVSPNDLSISKQLITRLENRICIPEKLDDLWPGKEGRLMTMLAADGNNIGQLLSGISSPKLYKEFSDTLVNLFDESLARGVDMMLDENLATAPIHLMPIIAGGDDISLLLPAENALDLAHTWARAFAEISKENDVFQQVISQFRSRNREYGENQFPGDGPWSLTLSIGVAIAKPHFPLTTYHRLSQELNKSAKYAMLVSPDESPLGAIDFAMITTAMIDRLADLRAQYAYRGEKRPTLTARPYLLSDFKVLLEIARFAQNPEHGLPRSKRKYLYEAIWRGHPQAEEALRFIALRHSNFAAKAGEQLRKLGCSISDNELPLDLPGGVSPWLDIIELAEILPEKSGGK